MQIAYQFKLYPNCEQSSRLSEWQQKVRSLLNLCLAERIDTYQDTFAQGEFCSLKQKGIATPLACSVNRSASLQGNLNFPSLSLVARLVLSLNQEQSELKTTKLSFLCLAG